MSTLLSDVLDIPKRAGTEDYVLLTDSVERDAVAPTLDEYVVTRRCPLCLLPVLTNADYRRTSSAGSSSTRNGQGITVSSPASAVTVWTNLPRRSSNAMMCGFGVSSNRQ